jgi:sugar transferase (PEP-CTERM/EpsH1 system associated)
LTRWIYSREGRTLFDLERKGARSADAVILVSTPEAELFKQLVPESASRVHTIQNGVDTDYFSDLVKLPNPFCERPAIVFTGSMDYRPNIDAVTWFVREVMPLVRSHPRSPCLWIVGANPAPSVQGLATADVRVTGRVPDVRPYLRHACAVVAPLQIGRGIQNKVLEAMAMGVPVVTTPQGREGLEKCEADEMLMADNPEDFAKAVLKVLDGKFPKMGLLARARVSKDFRWQDSLAELDRIIALAASRRSPEPDLQDANQQRPRITQQLLT